MAKGDVITVRINEITASGDGLARFGNKAVFVNRSCVGETVIVRIYDERPTWARAELQKIIGKPSPDRVEPQCKLYGICGGCTMQHLNYEAQLKAKVARFEDKFRHVAGFRPPELQVVSSRQWENQNYMRFLIRKETQYGKAAGVDLGLLNIRGNEFVPLPDCPVADPQIRSLLQNTAKTRSLELPPNTDEYIVFSSGNVFLTDMGRRRGRINLLDREITVDVNAHIAKNISVMETLLVNLTEIADCADHSKPMLDLYCGIGTLSAFVADKFPGVHLMDCNKNAISLARKNVTARNAQFFTVEDRDWVRDARPQTGYYGFMVADPPAIRGLNRNILDWIVWGGPPLLAYLSQDTASFAHDAKILCHQGYRLTRITMYDFIPHTGFTDTLAVFDRS